MFESQSEFSQAQTLLHRCIFMYECGFHSEFTPIKGNCRMSYDMSENRDFFRMLYKHAQFLGKKGCPRTALEILKLLLSLAPATDPLCIFMSLDYYAIRAKEFLYLFQVVAQYDPGNYISGCLTKEIPICLAPHLLPNMLYNIALTQYFIEKSKNHQGKDSAVDTGEIPMAARLRLPRQHRG
eukprot:TRINITY_DN5263_c0_g1_i1.p1 TRINITY_DN5263_c0_g1~~TRINITY_DN5263_c0_g1_i1.p1  ORF type:complete len:182 (-),score=22.81 TRINITY_DN5263_c0_g1_i1:2-547(-)